MFTQANKKWSFDGLAKFLELNAAMSERRREGTKREREREVAFFYECYSALDVAFYELS